MKFINYLESITGIGIYPLVSFLIFFLFFIGVGIYLLTAGERKFEEAARMPLDTNQNDFYI